MTIQNTDQYVVESNGTDFSVESQDVDQKVQDDDLFVVCRSGTPYKATYAEVKESMVVPAPPTMLSVSLVEADTEGDRFTSQSFVASSQVIDGEPISTKTIDAHVDGSLTVPTQTDPILSIGEKSLVYSAELSQTGGATNLPNIFDGTPARADMPLSSSITWDCSSFNLPPDAYYLQLNTLNPAGVNSVIRIEAEFSDRASTNFTITINTNGNILASLISAQDFSTEAIPTRVKATYEAGNGDFGWAYFAAPTTSPLTFLVDEVLPELVFTGNKDLDVLEAGDLVTGPAYQFNEPLESSIVNASGAWTSATTPEANYWNSVIYGNGKFVAVSDTGTNRVMYSTDGISWTSASASASNEWKALTYGNGKFVATSWDGANNQQVMYSTDGINWTSASSTEDNQWTSVAYAELPDGTKRFVAVAASGTNRVMYSTDAINWYGTRSAEDNAWQSVTYGGGKFVAVSWNGTNQVMYSTDGTTWTAAAAAVQSNQWYSVTYGETSTDTPGIPAGTGLFVATAAAGTNRVMYSTDGISWTSGSGAMGNTWFSVTYGDGKFVAVGGTGSYYDRVMYSTDGIYWTQTSAVEDNDWQSITYGDNKFLAVATTGTNQVMYSATGTGSKTDLTFANGTDMSELVVGDNISQNDTWGTIGSITGTVVNVSRGSAVSADNWVNGVNVIGPNRAGYATIGSLDPATNSMTLASYVTPFLVGQVCTGPQKTVDNARLYCVFDSSGNITDLQSNPQDPPYTTQDSNPGLTLTFPATFPSGQTPDEELPDGTTLTVDVSAANDSGTSGPLSATVQPVPGTPDVPLAGLTTLYTGNGSAKTITTGIDLVNNDGLVWVKRRNGSDGDNALFDTLRGVNQVLISNDTTESFENVGSLTAFTSSGFEAGASSFTNADPFDYVAWTFGKAEGYFDVVQYTGNGVAAQTINHSLATRPGFVITKSLDQTASWTCWHTGLTSEQWYIALDDAFAQADGSAATNWAITDTTFNVGAAVGNNTDTNSYIAYLFAEDTPDVIKCDQFTVSGGFATVTPGFKIGWVLVKCASGTGAWMILDNSRGWSATLSPNLNDPEDSFATITNITNNSFDINVGTAQTFIYVAIAESPDTRSQTPTELAETKLKFATFENRSMVKCGNDAEAARDNLIQELALQGYSLPDILELL